ncbi:hypothetical protein EWM64_g5809 [Hericium alpestre]|uniref:Integrase zinc-binding domain-containing protein n=1 Tax=Hericium alpestre TaxID=135208 RepID=A0A4Y9ZVD6_9AGAM|nr:hypothetical protein EWM64_g5809 [Hericium alpestre]
MPDSAIQDKLIAEANKFDKLRNLIEALQQQAPTFVDKGLDSWSLDDNGLLLYHGKIYVTKFDEICHKIIQQVHENPAYGHPGKW